MYNWAIIGAGRVAHRFMEGLLHEEDSRLYAIYGRNVQRLETFQEKYPCEKIYTDMEELLDDEKIDCVYISLPNRLHKEAIIKALQKGKAVLSEKPAVLKKEDLQEIEEVSKEKNVLFMEAMKTRFMPAYIELKKRIEEGVIGKIEHIDTRLIFPAGRGGLGFTPEDKGLFYGCGIYNANWYADFFEDLKVVSADCMYDNGEAVYLRALLEEDGHTSILEVGMDTRKYAEATVYGEKGYIVIPDFHRPVKAVICTDTIEKIDMDCEYGDFYPEAAHFIECLKEGRRESPLMRIEDSSRCLEVLEKIETAVREKH